MTYTKAGAGFLTMAAWTAVVLVMATVAAAPRALADDTEAQAKALKQVQRELRQLRADRAHDHKLIELLQQKLDQVQSQDNQIRTTSQQLQTTTEQLRRTHARLRSALITGSRRRSYGRPRSISSYLMQAVRSTPSTARARRPQAALAPRPTTARS
jgi:septal ring factor EnvC (AmiA/AmiB activator)